MKKYWISWFHSPVYGPFELNSPWWIRESEGLSYTIYAAVKANSEAEAKELVRNSYNKQLDAATFEWRFCEEKPADWSPFCDKFPKDNFMAWD